MSARNDGAKLPAPSRAGLLESTMQKLFTRRAQVVDIEDVGLSYRIVTLEGDALRNVEWTPGDKLQVQLGGWVQRTYTPMDWDAGKGRTRLLVYLHGDGPGTRWAKALRKGDECLFFGPRKSIKLARPRPSAILFGDETSLALATALSSQAPASVVHSVLEVSTLADTAPVIERLHLHGAHIHVRAANDAHFAGLEARISALLQADAAADIVLTGKASSVQQIGRLLRQEGVDAGRRQSKAYWAKGKTGLD